MKSHSLIIDLRSKLPWHKRYVSNTSTAMLWAAWILLWRPLILIIGVLSIQKPHIINNVLEAFGIGLQHGLTALLACAVALLLWSNFVPAKTIKKTAVKSLDDYTGHFNLPEQEVMTGRSQKISTVFHDEHGKIISIK